MNGETMIGYATLGTNDLPRAAAFYDTLLGEVGPKRLMDCGRRYAWNLSWDQPGLGILTPYDGNPATIGNGVMVALVVAWKDTVGRVCKRACELDARDEGPAGLHGEGFYASYLRDLDGDKLNVSCMG
jgi:catechol 2,3-dioxygenase-like lactoylglutathione lyase family enzyme